MISIKSKCLTSYMTMMMKMMSLYHRLNLLLMYTNHLLLVTIHLPSLVSRMINLNKISNSFLLYLVLSRKQHLPFSMMMTMMMRMDLS